jgi:signal transduction histidine kinase
MPACNAVQSICGDRELGDPSLEEGAPAGRGRPASPVARVWGGVGTNARDPTPREWNGGCKPGPYVVSTDGEEQGRAKGAGRKWIMHHSTVIEAMVQSVVGGEPSATAKGLEIVLELVREAVGAQTATMLSYDRGTQAVAAATFVGTADASRVLEEEMSAATLVERELAAARGGPAQERFGFAEVGDELRRWGIHAVFRVRLARHADRVDVLYLGLPAVQRAGELDRLLARLEPIVPWVEAAQWCARLGDTISALHDQRDLRNKMVSLVAHDLRGSLSAAKLAAQLLTHDPGVDDGRRQLAEKIDMNIDRTERMLRDLLEVNRVHSGRSVSIRRRRCDLSAVARRVGEGLRATHAERFVVRAPDEAWGEWDADQLHRVLWNLGKVAVEQGPMSTQIAIELTADERSARVVIHPIVLHTRDGSPRVELGLALAHGCAEAHGGNVEVRPERLVLTLPREPPSEARGPADRS